MHPLAGVNFENFTEVKFRDILRTGTGHRDRCLIRDSPGQTGTYGRSNLNQNLKPKPNFRFIRERPFAIPSYHQKCRPPEKCRPGALPPCPPRRGPGCQCIFKALHRCFVNIYLYGFKSPERNGDLKSMSFFHNVTSMLVNDTFLFAQAYFV